MNIATFYFDLPRSRKPKFRSKGFARFRLPVQVKEKICHLYIIFEPLSGRGHDDEPSRRITPDNITDLANLAGVRNRGAAELGDNNAFLHDDPSMA